MQTSQKIKFAVLGCGHIGRRHVEVITANSEAELVAAADPDRSQKTGMAALDKIPFFSSLDELLASGIAADVLTIATPNGLHAEHAMAAIRNNLHVVIEKPMGLTRVSCEEVIAAAHSSYRKVFCVMQNRYSSTSVWLKALVDSGILGKIYLVQIQCFWNRDIRYYGNSRSPWRGTMALDGGPLFTQFSHFVDVMFWLFGGITNIKASFNNFNHANLTEFSDDTGRIHFEFLKGGSGSFSYSTAVWDKNLESSITIIAENGSVKVGGQYMERVDYCHVAGYTLPHLSPAGPPNDYGSHQGSAANHHHTIQNVVDVLLRGAPITATAEEGLAVVDMIERIYRQRPS